MNTSSSILCTKSLFDEIQNIFNDIKKEILVTEVPSEVPSEVPQEPSYEETISEVKRIAKDIAVSRIGGDGRTESAIKEGPFLNIMKELLLLNHPTWEIYIKKPRDSCDITINGIRINLKLTDCKTADNSVSKYSIYNSITGRSDYPSQSNWNQFLDRIIIAKEKKYIKMKRDNKTEYHYLVKNKINGNVLLKSIFDIHTYIINPSNDLQINWRN